MAKKILAVNGSPRKTWNTATLLEKALAGAAAKGAEVELVHLYDLEYKGCVSCFACKTKAGSHSGKCVVRDGLAPLLQKAADADALILGSPVYMGSATGEFRSFMERLGFPFLYYSNPPSSVFTRKIPVGLVFTMNLTQELAERGPFPCIPTLTQIERLMAQIFGHAETLYCYDTFQFEDYSKMDAPRFDPDAKAKRRRDVFPQDCEKAYAMGEKFATP